MNSRLQGDWFGKGGRPILEGEGVLLGDVFRYPAQDFYVDQVGGAVAKDGLTPETALAGIQAAINKAVSGRGDRIWIKPGTYEENLDTTGKDYVHLIGVIAAGYARPDVVPTSGSAIKALSQGVICAHLRFVAIDALPAMVQAGNGFVHLDCVFDGDGNTGPLLLYKGDAQDDHLTASEGKTLGCLIRGSGGVGVAFQTAEPLNGVGCTDNVLKECVFVDNADEDILAVDSDAGGTTYTVLRQLIERCHFMTKDKPVYIDLSNIAGFTTANGGSVSDNYFAGALDTDTVKIASTDFVMVNNHGPDVLAAP